MFNSNILDVMIGVVFIFMLLSMATSWFTEFWAQVLKLRSMHLKDYLRDWIDSGNAAGFVEDLYKGNVIGALYDSAPEDPDKIDKVENMATLSFVLPHEPE